MKWNEMKDSSICYFFAHSLDKTYFFYEFLEWKDFLDNSSYSYIVRICEHLFLDDKKCTIRELH